MRVDPLVQLSEAITSVFEAIVIPSIVVLAAALVVVAALELRTRLPRRPQHRGPRRAALRPLQASTRPRRIA